MAPSASQVAAAEIAWFWSTHRRTCQGHDGADLREELGRLVCAGGQAASCDKPVVRRTP